MNKLITGIAIFWAVQKLMKTQKLMTIEKIAKVWKNYKQKIFDYCDNLSFSRIDKNSKSDDNSKNSEFLEETHKVVNYCNNLSLSRIKDGSKIDAPRSFFH